MTFPELLQQIKRFTLDDMPNKTFIREVDIQKVFNSTIQFMYDNMNNGDLFNWYGGVRYRSKYGKYGIGDVSDPNIKIDIRILMREKFIYIRIPQTHTLTVNDLTYSVYILHKTKDDWKPKRSFNELVENLPDELKAWLYLNGIDPDKEAI